MKSKIDKQYFIIGEIGQQKRISSNKDLSQKLESSLKDLGLTKNDIILISSNNLKNMIQQISSNKEKNINNYKEKYNDIFNNNLNEDYYLFSKTNRYEIYKQQFEIFFKSKIEQNTFLSSKDLFGGGIAPLGGGDDIFLSGNKFNMNNNNIKTQKIISHIKDVYTNFKTLSININTNFFFANSLINENIGNIYKSLSILYNYYKNKIQNIRINQETLKTCFEEVNSKVLSLEKKINNFFTIKMSLNNKKEIELFELLISENKIKQIKEKINNQLNYLKEKIKNKSQKFDDMVSNNMDDTNNFGNKFKNVIDEKMLNEIKNKIKIIELNFNDLNKKYNRYKFEDEIKQIQENNINNININNSNFTFSNSNNFNNQNNNNDKELYKFKGEEDLNNLIATIKNIKNNSEEILSEIKNFIKDSIIKKFFRFSSDIFITLESFESYNKKFKSYISLLENIDKDNFDLLFSLDEALKFRFYCNEYERRINFLKDLKKTIFKLKKSLTKENEIRQKFNDELVEYFNGKINDNKFGIHSNIISFFDWDDIKGNFDVYGDKYYNNIEINEDELNIDNNIRNKNLKISLKISEGEINTNDNLNLEYYSQQEMIYHLNNKIMEYKSKIKELEKDIENKNSEFKELKFDIEQINNFLNSLYKKKINNEINSHEENKINNKSNDSDNNNIKKENKIFNPLYDEINEEESFTIHNINNKNSNSSNEEFKKNKNIHNKNNNNEDFDNIFLSLEQNYIIKKTFFNYFTNLLSIKNEEFNKLSSLYNSLQMSIEDKFSEILLLSSINKINLITIKIGTTNIFIGNGKGIYACFLLNEYTNKNNNYICEYYLDIDNINEDIKYILNKEKNIIIIGKVKDIRKDKNIKNKDDNLNDNKYNINYKKNSKKLVVLNDIQYLISFQNDIQSNEIVFKNHIIYNKL